MPTTLGLDLGPNSIGWALIDESGPATGRIIDLGVRIFPEGVDNFDTSKEQSRNEARRVARSMRRQTRRRAARRRALRDALVTCGLWPADAAEADRLLALDPYELRARAVDPQAEPLTPHELGRVLLHLNQRRGFLSIRKRDRKDRELKGMLAEISELEREIQDANPPTLGRLLHGKLQALDPCQRREGDHVRRRHTHRHMIEDEFNRIWQTQQRHHPHLLTDRLRYGTVGRRRYPARPIRRPRGQTLLEAFGIHGIMFNHRQIFWPRSVVGSCELEPKQPRCPRADRRAQRFRMLQEVNNLRYIDPTQRSERRLDDQQRALLIDRLSHRREMTFDQVRRELGFLDNIRFNLEKGERSKLKGLVTEYELAKATGKSWWNRPEAQRNQIVDLLLDSNTDDDDKQARLVDDFGLTSAQAHAALLADLPSGHVRFSVRAIENLLPHLERGLVLMDDDAGNSALHAAGYLRPDELQRRVFDRLPDPQRSRDCPIGDIPNPVVKRALVELRKVVNAIIREYGKPDEVHIEMGRQVKQGEEARRKYNKTIRQREAERNEAADLLREHGIRVSRDAINRILLWKEQGEICTYTGRPISFRQLFGGEVDIDHILPYSRCLDDSLMNKVVVFRDANAQKRDQSPWEWLGERDPDRFNEITHRARRLPYPKYRRFLLKELQLDSFIARQLVDTSYIARATVAYLQCLFESDQRHSVWGMKGQLTAELRHQWGLNRILGGEDGGMKLRDDHRHHAIDAVVCALTSRSRMHGLTRIRKAGGVLQTGEALDPPWEGFRDELARRIARVNVSHRAERKIAGALHKEKPYGPLRVPGGERKEGLFVIRTSLDELSANEVEMIRDPVVRRVITQRLAEHGIETGRAKGEATRKMKAVLCDPDNPVRMPTRNPDKLGPPIRRVRVIRRDLTIRALGRNDDAGGSTFDPAEDRTKFVKPGATHHLSLFEWAVNGKTRRDAVFTSMLDAADRLKLRQQYVKERVTALEKQRVSRISRKGPECGDLMREAERRYPTITRVHPEHSEAKFLFSLRRGEYVLADVDGKQVLLVFNTAASTEKQLRFFHHADARPSNKSQKSGQRRLYRFQPSTLNARKVTVDTLGRIRWAND